MESGSSPDLDKKDLQIIALLLHEPFLSQAEISERLGIAQSTVSTRISRLNKDKILRTSTCISVQKIGLHTGVVTLNTRDAGAVLEIVSRCPLLVNGHATIGSRNVTLLYVAEDVKTFQDVVDKHLKTIKGVEEANFAQIIQSCKDFTLSINAHQPMAPIPPCGILPFCYNCPADKNYKGLLRFSTKK